MKIRFESGDYLRLGKTFSISDMIIFAASVLDKNGKYYPQFFNINVRTSYKNAAIRKN